jgi:ribonuclease PH
MRPDGRQFDEVRPVKFRRRYTRGAPGSVLVQTGRTTVLCTVSVEESVPRWLAGQGKGWLTAEYSMLPGASQPRKPRERSGKIDGRTAEIQRLIGRSLRAVVDLSRLGETTLWLDCDVLEADGGTRTASITGAFVALVDALHSWRPEVLKAPSPVLRDSVAAVSVGVVDGSHRLDLDYQEDVAAEVDFNLVMTGSGQFIEVQGTGEGSTFTRRQLDEMLRLGKLGIEKLTKLQQRALGTLWPMSGKGPKLAD